ncbi:MAG TPA: glycosyltransferase [Planctomycetota bacterium]|jgi:glycosyltransferase involved in cell wall biosynthesis|nr:glycosyltransferase [Planctomycetota bacterium]
MTLPREPALSVLIATYDRPESLVETLRCLSACSSREFFEVVVIDNGREPFVSAAMLDLPGLPAHRLLREARGGKSHALNRALEEGGLAEIVAVLDDDTSPAADWIDAVLAASRRLPEYSIFAGRTRIDWPKGFDVPRWARTRLAGGILFSVFDSGRDQDVEFGVDSPRFPSGNHFWFRRSLLSEGVRFPAVWTTEAHFVVQLQARGHRGVFVSAPLVGHRVQPRLLDPHVFEERALHFGRDMASLETCSGPVEMRRWLRRVRAIAALAGWSTAWLGTRLAGNGIGLSARARALWGIALNRERLRHPRKAG